MSFYKQDKIENEKSDPIEGSSLKFINVPLVLLSLLLGFGVSYLVLQTDKVTMEVGDSRTVEKPAQSLESTEVNSADNLNASDLSVLMEKGKRVFTTSCQACHQATGKGIPGAFPPLEGSEWVTGSPQRVVAIVLHGLQGEITVKGQTYQGVMPAFEDQLSVEDVASVTTYIRNSFGNKSEKITIDLVDQVIKTTVNKKTPWNGEQELNAQDWN